MKEVMQISKKIIDVCKNEKRPLTPLDIAKKTNLSRMLIYLGLGFLLGSNKIKMNKVGNRWIVEIK